MTHYNPEVKRTTETAQPNEAAYSVAKYEVVIFGEDDKGKPTRENKTVEIDTRTRGRGKLPSVHPEFPGSRLVEIVTFKPDLEQRKAFKLEARATKKAEKIQNKRKAYEDMSPEEKAEHDKKLADRQAQYKQNQKNKLADKKAAEDAEMIKLGFVDAEGKPLDKRSATYRALIGKGAKPKNDKLLSVPKNETDHTKYIAVNRREMLEGIVSEGEQVFVSDNTFNLEASQFEHRRPAVFKGFTTIKIGKNEIQVAQVEMVMGKRVEIVPVKRGGIYILKTDAARAEANNAKAVEQAQTPAE